MGRPASSRSSVEQYATLEARVKHVSEATIRKKWKKLPASGHTAAREAILSAKIQSRSRKGKVAIDMATEDCVQLVIDKLIDRLPRIPFPPSTDEHHFDHEANLHRISKVEEQLTTNIHTIDLLRAQIAKEEKLLKQDEAEVEHLEKSLRANEVTRRNQTKTFHSIARDLGRDRQDIDLLALETRDKDTLQASMVDLFQDEGLKPVLQQLQNHMDSMQNNVKDLGEVKDNVRQATHELRAYAFCHLAEETYRGASGLLEANVT